MPGRGGRCHRTIPLPDFPPQPGHPTRTGTTVEEWSAPVVVIQVLVVSFASVIV